MYRNFFDLVYIYIFSLFKTLSIFSTGKTLLIFLLLIKSPLLCELLGLFPSIASPTYSSGMQYISQTPAMEIELNSSLQ